MKKPIIYLSLMLALTACEAKKDISSIDSSLSSVAEVNIEYKIENTILSKGFQSIIPNVEVLEKEHGRFFLVNLGIVECSMADIDSISKVNNEINIYTSIKKQWGKTDIVVPQITIKVENLEELDLKNVKFNIVPTDYNPINIKFDKAQALNKIYSQFNYSDNTMPNIVLTKDKNEYIWSIKLNNTFMKDNPSSPLYMFSAKVSSDNGEIIDSKSTLLSDTLGKGKILDFANDELMAYSQVETLEEVVSENIWLLDINSSEKKRVYSTRNFIYSAKFSPDLKKLAVIEHDGELSDLYIVDLETNLVQKITPIEYKHTWNIKWKDNSSLYAINNYEQEKSTILLFDILKNEQKILFAAKVNVISFDVVDNTFAFTAYDSAEDLSSVYIKNSDESLKIIGHGHASKFIDEDKVIYTKKIENADRFQLYLYDLNEHEEKSLTDFNIQNFLIVDERNILIVSKDSSSIDYNVSIYDLKKDEYSLLGRVLDKNIFYSPSLNTAYFSIIPPVNGADSRYIYGINFDNLKKYQKDS